MGTRRTNDRPAAPAAGAAPVVGVVSGVALLVAAFLPWYTTNVAPPFAAGDSSGWDATVVARIALVLGVVVAAAALAAALDEREVLRIAPRWGDAVGWIVVAASALAAVLVAYRVIVLPEPAEFLSRQIGLYLALAASVGGVLSGLALLATRR